MKPEYKVDYMEADLDQILAYWANEYSPVDGSTVTSTNWFVDHAKGKVIFKIATTKKVDE